MQLYAPSTAAGGRQRLRGRLLEMVGGRGEGRLQLQLTTDEALSSERAEAGSSQRKTTKARRASSSKSP